MVSSMMRFYFGEVCVSDNFQEIHYNGDKKEEFVYSCNSTLFQLFLNVMGRANFGDGLMRLQTFEVERLILIDPKLISFDSKAQNCFQTFIERDMGSLFNELGFDPQKVIRSQTPKPMPDRKVLDNIIFDELGLTQNERNEVYWSVAELVKQRLDKAASR